MEPCYSSSIVTQVSVSQALQLFVVIKDSGMALNQAVNHQVSSNWCKSVGRTERYEYCKCRKAQKESMKASVLILFLKNQRIFVSVLSLNLVVLLFRYEEEPETVVCPRFCHSRDRTHCSGYYGLLLY